MARYSPDETLLAVGSHDNHVYIYEVREDASYHLVCKDHRNSSYINAIDWSLDGNSIRTSSGDYEVLYYDVKERKANPYGSEQEFEWATNTVKVGKDRENTKPSGEDGTHINDMCGTQDGAMLLSADDFGLVNLFHWPEPHTDESRSFCGHSEHVVRVAVTPDQKYVFTIGGGDKTLI